jgi:hypothetical protein
VGSTGTCTMPALFDSRASSGGRSMAGTAFALLSAALILGVTVFAGSSPAHRWVSARATPGLEHGPCPAPGARLGLARRAATFVFRVQQPFDVELLGRIRAHRRRDLPTKNRDVFLVRARGKGAGEASEMISRLRNTSLLSGEQFVCNRIATLTGVRTDGAIPREDLYNQAGSPRVWGVFPDWERRLWHLSYPSTPQWSSRFFVNLRRIRSRAEGIRSRGKHAGVVITGWRYQGPHPWKYGRLAKRARLAGGIIQTQGECQMSPSRFAHRARRLLTQYRNAGVSRAKLAMQVSFAARPGSTPLPHDVTPNRAARCTRAAWAAGVRTFLLWAYPRSLGAYFASLPDWIRK